MEENAALRKASAVLNGHITRLAERLLLLAEEEEEEEETKRPMLLDTPSLRSPKVADAEGRQFYVRVELLGRKSEFSWNAILVPFYRFTFFVFSSDLNYLHSLFSALTT